MPSEQLYAAYFTNSVEYSVKHLGGWVLKIEKRRRRNHVILAMQQNEIMESLACQL